MDLFALTGIFLLGTAVAVPAAYLFSWASGSIFWGVIITFLLCIPFIRIKKVRLDTSSVLLVLLSLALSSWLMFKTFHGNLSGELFVGSNNIFDFGMMLGLVRSMSWGANIPFMSPFFAGAPYFYHFLFTFWVALLEYFGMPIVWALNIPSILSFTALLVMVYYLPQKLFGQKPFVGWISVLLTITNSSLTFWKLLLQKTDLWHMPTYPFAGPFDGSTISIFVTLNSYVNQRHLAFSLALALFLLMWVMNRKKQVVLVGFLTGILMLWNVPVSILTACVVFLLLRANMRFALGAAGGMVVALVPYVGQIPTILGFLAMQTAKGAAQAAALATWNPLSYFWQNLGILPVMALVGFFVISKKYRWTAAVIWFLFILESLLAIIGNRGFDQKSYSYIIILVNAVVAVGLVWIWKKGTYLAVIIGFVLTVSGFVDLIPIKNEFAYPLIGKDMIPVISWIKNNTLKNAVFVSYADIIDPVVLAGRKNYFGFFGNIGWYDRTESVARIFGGDLSYAKTQNISYIVVPKWKKDDFLYAVDRVALTRLSNTVYEDERFIVYAVP